MAPTELATYFSAERQGGIVLVLMAVASFGFSAWLWSTRHAFMAMAWPIVVLGAFQLIIGLTVALRTPAQVAALEEGFRNAPAATAAAEASRMASVNRNFRIVKAVEVVLILAGLALVFLLPHPGTWPAVGLGLLAEASALLVFDAFAHHRGLGYAQWLAGIG